MLSAIALETADPMIGDEKRGQIWRRLADWDLGDPQAEEGFTFQDKLVKNLGWTEEYTLRVMDEFRRFVFLWVCYGDARHVPSKAVDEVWHQSILFTRRYALMCHHFCGKFRHHNPTTSSGHKASLRDAYVETLDRYFKVFGQEPPADIWTVPTPVLQCITECTSPCDQCGGGPGCEGACQVCDEDCE